MSLSTVIAVYTVQQFDIPRPKALLGHENWQKVLEQVRRAMDLSSRDDFEMLYLSAAGSDSSVMVRIKETLAEETALRMSDDEGDLLLRLRRTPKTQQGWDLLVRLTPRPLASRDWRVCNMEGALNASVAHLLHLKYRLHGFYFRLH